MKRAIELKTIRELSVAELRKKVDELDEELMRLRFKHGGGQLDHHAQLTTIRRNIARTRTVMREKQAQA